MNSLAQTEYAVRIAAERRRTEAAHRAFAAAARTTGVTEAVPARRGLLARLRPAVR